MRLLKLLSLFLLSICLSGMGDAVVSLQMSLCNSDDDLSIDLIAENMDFHAMANLMPDSLLYQNGGVSTQPDGYYSYSITLNGETLESGAETNSGSFSLSATADSNSYGDGSSRFSLGANSKVKNGDLKIYYANPDNRVEETIHTDNAVYSQKVMTTPSSMKSSGLGAIIGTSQPDSNAGDSNAEEGFDQKENNNDNPPEESPQITGVREVMSVTGAKSAIIETNVNGNTLAQWRDGFRSNPSGYAFGQEIQGIVRTSLNELEMKGEAMGFPTQRLPPGDVKISSRHVSEIEEEARFKHIIGEISAFKEEYPQSETPALWYYLNQKAYINPEEGDSPGITHKPLELYKMSMGFTITD